ncbi:hypothetical protein GCM10017602_13270 [Herbiconiux flava]|nr:hypothetical protein GCM10017602_13270 [Herbiconiux flava]
MPERTTAPGLVAEEFSSAKVLPEATVPSSTAPPARAVATSIRFTGEGDAEGPRSEDGPGRRARTRRPEPWGVTG